MLIADQQDGHPGRDRVSFFIFPRSEVAPAVYEYAYTMVEGKSPAEMPACSARRSPRRSRSPGRLPPDTVGSGYYALMRLDEFVASRIVEAVVHGIDLTDALGREPIATPEGIAFTAALLDELLARRTVAGPTSTCRRRRVDPRRLGTTPHPDPRLPLIG